MADDDTTRIIKRRVLVGEGDTTTPIGKRAAADGVMDADPQTKLYRPKPSNSAPSGGQEGRALVDDFSGEPVVGWLVVVAGPGRGQSIKLGYGMNSIGRGSEERVSLDFGDEEISRQGHAMLTYDSKGRKFYIQHGGGTNLTYLGESPVLQPHELLGRETIGLGNTQLCFIPFCGPEFEW